MYLRAALWFLSDCWRSASSLEPGYRFMDRSRRRMGYRMTAAPDGSVGTVRGTCAPSKIDRYLFLWLTWIRQTDPVRQSWIIFVTTLPQQIIINFQKYTLCCYRSFSLPYHRLLERRVHYCLTVAKSAVWPPVTSLCCYGSFSLPYHRPLERRLVPLKRGKEKIRAPE